MRLLYCLHFVSGLSAKPHLQEGIGAQALKDLSGTAKDLKDLRAELDDGPTSWDDFGTLPPLNAEPAAASAQPEEQGLGLFGPVGRQSAVVGADGSLISMGSPADVADLTLTTQQPPELQREPELPAPPGLVERLLPFNTQRLAQAFVAPLVAPLVLRVRGAVNLMVTDGTDALVLAELSEHDIFLITVTVSLIAVFVILAMMWWVHTRHGNALPRGERTVGELAGLTAFRFYAGMLMCTWLPFVLAEEGSSLWPDHQSMFMGVGKIILASAMVLCPVFGLMNDQTLHPWGRRRLFFMVGVLLITFGIALCAFSSLRRWPLLYLAGTLLWSLGESSAESTTEALVPDLCVPEDYTRAASMRGVMFMAGGLVGYGMIILTAAVFQWNQSVFYIYYIVCVLIGAPWSIHYASPTDAEKRALERLNDPSSAHEALREGEQVPGDADASIPIDQEDNGKSYWQRCYADCYNASPMFRIVSLGTVVLSMGSAGMMFVLLVLRDLVGVDDPVTQQVHLGLISMALMLTGSITSVIIGFVGMDSNQRWWWMGIFITLNCICEVLVPCAVLAPDVPQRLYILYGVACLKGVGFGGMYNLMQPLTWEAIPDHWKSGVGSVARATAWISVTRSFGIGVGNFAGGFLLDFARAINEDQDLAGGKKYPPLGYFLLFGYCAVSGIIGGLMLNSVNPNNSKGTPRGSISYAGGDLVALEERRPSRGVIPDQG